MRRRINLLAMLLVCAGGGVLTGHAEARVTSSPDDETPKDYCCRHTFWPEGCCGDNGCRITSKRCETW
jgi:hypothetical protein